MVLRHRNGNFYPLSFFVFAFCRQCAWFLLFLRRQNGSLLNSTFCALWRPMPNNSFLRVIGVTFYSSCCLLMPSRGWMTNWWAHFMLVVGQICIVVMLHLFKRWTNYGWFVTISVSLSPYSSFIKKMRYTYLLSIYRNLKHNLWKDYF